MGCNTRNYDREAKKMNKGHEMEFKYEIGQTPNGYMGVLCTVPIEKKEVILELVGLWHPYPTRTSIQIKSNHLESEIGAYLNHNCNPNAEILAGCKLVSTREIDEGEEITFDYNTTEDVLANPFKCNCCGKEIKGKNYG